MANKCYVHIGMHKTGSSSIQETFCGEGFKSVKVKYFPILGPNHGVGFKKLFPDIDKLEPVFFCQIIASEEEIRPITPARNAIKLKSPIRSEIIIIDAPLNPKNIPIF